MAKAHSYRELIAILVEYDRRFEVYFHRGKGSHRMIVHPNVNGRRVSYPVKFHGEKTELRPGTISAIIRAFDLPRDLL